MPKKDLRIILTPKEASQFIPSPTQESWILSYGNVALIVEMDKEGPFEPRVVPGFSTLTPEKGGIAITNSSKVPELNKTTMDEIIGQVAKSL